MGYQAPAVPEDYETSVWEDIRIYISKNVKLRGPALRVRLAKGWLGSSIEIEGIQLVPGGR